MLQRPVPSVSGSKRTNPIEISFLSSSLMDSGLNASPLNSSILVFQYLASLMAASYRKMMRLSEKLFIVASE